VKKDKIHSRQGAATCAFLSFYKSGAFACKIVQNAPWREINKSQNGTTIVKIY
jgi:hypothetical protein